MNKQVFIIAWDGATWEVLKPLAESGIMPNLKKIMEKGFISNLESVIPPLTAPAWISFMTGKTPGKHGIFDFRSFDSLTKKDHITNLSFCRSRTIWEILSDSGKKSIVLNLPYMFPPVHINGIVISGFDTPGSAVDFIYPDDVKSDILKRWPDYKPAMPLWDCCAIEDSIEAKKYLAMAKKMVELRTDIALYLADNYAWDVFLVHFQEIDYIQHIFWNVIEKLILNERIELFKEITDFFVSLDNSLVRLIAFADSKEAISLLISDHGFGPHPGMIYPNVLLKESGYLHQRIKKLKSNFHYAVRRINASIIRKFPLKIVKKIIRFKNKIFSDRSELWIDNEKLRVSIENLNIEWDKTKALMAMGDFYAIIFVNKGIIKPEDYEHTLDELSAIFFKAKHKDGKKNLFCDIFKVREIYNLDDTYDSLPDLILVPSDGFSVARDIDTDEIVHYGFPGISGMHRMEGVLLIRGKDVNIKKDDLAPRIIDLAPMILYLQGLEIPFDMDGKVLKSIFKFTLPIIISNKSSQKISQDIAYSQSEEESIAKRLKSLGYLQ
jgi:predicted AlkP superfamily phosphohydrolase/phosphomutase